MLITSTIYLFNGCTKTKESEIVKNRLDYLHLKEVGFIELLVAFYPLLGQYVYGRFYLEFVVLLVIDILLIFRGFSKREGSKNYRYKPLELMMAFYILHEIVVYFAAGFPSYMLGRMFTNIVVGISVPIIASRIDIKKLIGSLTWVSIMCAVGMVYHFLLIATGIGTVNPLTLPCMPELDLSSRAFENIYRPTSFFWEPASYATFITLIVFIYLREKKYVIAGIFAMTIFLSTSTTGILYVFILLVGFVLFGKIKTSNKVLITISFVALAIALFNVSEFSFGLEKLQNTEIVGNQRLSNGPQLIKEMPLGDLILGVPYANLNDYIMSNSSLHSGALVAHGENGEYFVSDFWYVLAKFGIVGIFFLIWIYYSAFKKIPTLKPYILTLAIGLFSQGIFLRSFWAYEWIFVLAIYFQFYYQKKLA